MNNYVMKDCKRFVTKVKKLKLYTIEFEENNIMKDNIYLSNYVLYSLDY